MQLVKVQKSFRILRIKQQFDAEKKGYNCSRSTNKSLNSQLRYIKVFFEKQKKKPINTLKKVTSSESAQFYFIVVEATVKNWKFFTKNKKWVKSEKKNEYQSENEMMNILDLKKEIFELQWMELDGWLCWLSPNDNFLSLQTNQLAWWNFTHSKSLNKKKKCP